MRQHNALRMTRRTRAIYQERKVFLGVYLCLSVPRCAGDVTNAGEMLEFRCLVSLIAHQDDAVFVDAHSLTGLDGGLEEWLLRHQCLCTRVL